MAIRFAVQADTEQECAEGLEQLLTRMLTDSRWMARAVPRMTEAPAGDDPGRGSVAPG